MNQLAIEGGKPVRSEPLPFWPYHDEDEIKAAATIMKTGRVNYWTGEEGRTFEKEFAAFAGADYAVALMNGTVALEAALYALGIGPGDEVIVTSRTFIASASAVVMRGAVPVVADVDPASQNITAETIAPLITPRTRGIITVHLAGWPCDMDPIVELARRHHIQVIEDCAQAHGAEYKGRPVGSLGNVAAFSFCQDKIMTTGGEGGMLLTSNRTIWERAWSFKDHGKSYDAVYHREHPPGFRWLHESFGTNWRLTEMQSAIGRIQLRKLTRWRDVRRRNADILMSSFTRIPALRTPVAPDHIRHAYYKYYTFVKPEYLKSNWDRNRIMTAIEAEGIFCQSGICSEIYLEKAFENSEFRPRERRPTARELGETSLMFLVHPTLTEKDMLDTARAVDKVMTAAVR
jgi:dTDP-4-amino-4,6-dideoxygalactose transaminase